MENFLANRFGVVNWRQPHLITLRAWNRVRDWNRCQWSDALGLLGLFLFSFGVFYRTLLVHEGLLLMGLAFALRIRTLEKGVMRDPLLILSAAFLLFLLIRTYYTLSEFKEYQSLIWEDMLKLFLFGFLVVFLVAFWMNRYQDRWNQLVIALFAGHIVRVFRKFDWGIFYYEFDKIWNGVYRIGWGSTVNRFGLWSAVIFFGCVILYRHIWGARRQSNELMYWLRVMLWTLAVILSGAGLVYSQSRSAWLAAVLVIPVMLFFQFHQRKKLKLKPVVFIGVLLVVISFMTNLPAVVENRLFLSTNPFYNESFKAAIDARLLLYRLSWEKWKERPWFGYGPGISEVIIKQTEDEYALVRMYNHFHNVA
jgi:O-antigen ligase